MRVRLRVCQQQCVLTFDFDKTKVYVSLAQSGPDYHSTENTGLSKAPSTQTGHETTYLPCQPRNTTTEYGMMPIAIVAVLELASGSSLYTLQQASLVRLPS